MNDFVEWVDEGKRSYNRPYSYEQWAVDVLKAAREGKPVDERIVAKARLIVDGTPNLNGLHSLLRAINQVAYSRIVAEDRIVEKYTNKYTVIDFRLRGWHEAQRVREAHLQHWEDVQETLVELKRAG